MDYRKEMLALLEYLKKKNHSRRKIEQYLNYAPKTLDQILSKGGNELAVIKLKEYKNQVDKGNITSLPVNELYKDKNLLADRILIETMLLEIAKLKAKVFGMNVDDAIDELEKNSTLALRKAERNNR